MQRTRSSAWFFVGMGFLVAVINVVPLWDHLRVVDWIVLAMLMAVPPLGLWRHFREVDEVTEKVYRTAMQIALGYVPLWWGLGLAGRMLNR